MHKIIRVTRRKHLLFLATIALLCLPFNATAQALAPITYVPPQGEIDPTRFDTARSSTPVHTIAVLAPEHTGLTIKEQPTLYWYVSGPSMAVVELTIQDEQDGVTVLDKELEAKQLEGIEQIRLKKWGLKLKPDRVYRWSISLIAEPGAEAPFSSGTIRIGEQRATLLASSKTETGPALPAFYAGNSIWYETLSELTALIDSAADEETRRPMRLERASLFDQVSRHSVADFDRELR